MERSGVFLVFPTVQAHCRSPTGRSSTGSNAPRPYKWLGRRMQCDLHFRWDRYRDAACYAHVAQAPDVSSMHAPLFGLRVTVSIFLARTFKKYYPGQKKRPLRLCIKSEHCSYHAISAWSGDWHSGAAGRDFAHRCTPKRNQAWFFDIPWLEQCSAFMHNLSGRFFLSRVVALIPIACSTAVKVLYSTVATAQLAVHTETESSGFAGNSIRHRHSRCRILSQNVQLSTNDRAFARRVSSVTCTTWVRNLHTPKSMFFTCPNLSHSWNKKWQR